MTFHSRFRAAAAVAAVAVATTFGAGMALAQPHGPHGHPGAGGVEIGRLIAHANTTAMTTPSEIREAGTQPLQRPDRIVGVDGVGERRQARPARRLERAQQLGHPRGLRRTARTRGRSRAAASWRAVVVLPNPPGASSSTTAASPTSARTRGRATRALELLLRMPSASCSGRCGPGRRCCHTRPASAAGRWTLVGRPSASIRACTDRSFSDCFPAARAGDRLAGVAEEVETGERMAFRDAADLVDRAPAHPAMGRRVTQRSRSTPLRTGTGAAGRR